MKRFVIMMVLAVCVGVVGVRADPATEEEAFDLCGGAPNKSTALTQDYYMSVPTEVATLAIETQYSCPFFSLSATGAVQGMENTSLSTAWTVNLSAGSRTVVLNYNHTYQARSEHFSWFWLGIIMPVRSAGLTSDDVEMVAPQAPPDEQWHCEFVLLGVWDSGHCALPNSPILTGRHGYKLTSVEDGVRFDLNADGVAELVAWTEPETENAWLAMDRNGNGTIDAGSELFGNHTSVRFSGPTLTTTNGFEALKMFESPQNGAILGGDNNITAADLGFDRLLLWTDRNHNGISEPDELQSAAHAGLLSISTKYDERKRRDEHGNEFRQKGTSEWNRKGKVKSEVVWDVWLQSRQ
jgi:hypothetical protein